ncbi:5-formyltetrahydrofolate cyclo-ligase [Lutibaculum baratangense]|uniref:5-formyltetrahydrofolate cyclo-ligase n=1 Tax=Lutibaculum baratangense AMV1 TaxID=631454 RepID=V4QV77_9HYPH|nr:5-formyltetrahydrofolate cyclo-ligase [Lutibaculum baratangense]ESR23667.1 5-formyltetrahydrofolate cyclo-ligase [Lutibaculum baratangense AMV1]
MNDASGKAHLRRLAAARRDRLTAVERQRKAAALAEAAPTIHRLARGGVVSCFSSFGNELDTAPLIAALDRLGCRLALPVVGRKGHPLTFRPWRPGDEMKPGPFGILQPLPERGRVEPSLFLAPLLLFDREGYRLGYGGGFYDRTLQEARSRRKILAIGLAFAEQEFPRVPRESYDQRLDGVLTDEGIVRCQGGGIAHSLPW